MTQVATRELFSEAKALYAKPLLDLISEAHHVHLKHHTLGDIQRCSLLSVKTGGCPEDCAYCPQSAHYKTSVDRQSLLSPTDVREQARLARDAGATRFCIGAAWRSPPQGQAFDQVLEMVREIKAVGLEACATLGMLTDSQARSLKQAGLDAYNHNIDTGPDHYAEIITTRTFEDRIRTLQRVREAGLSVCSGGIIGMGESPDDRCAMLAELASLMPQPESVPINLLVPVEGTPLAHAGPVSPLDLARVVAVARILMPQSRVRLSAGRSCLSPEVQTLAFLAGANSIFYGERLLTRENPHPDQDRALLGELCDGLQLD